MAEKRWFTDVLLQWLFQLASDPRVWGICTFVTSCRNCRQTDEVWGSFHPPSRELKEEHLRKVKSCGTFRYNQAVVFSFSIKAWLIFISVSSEVVETRVIKPNTSIHDVKAKKLMGYYYIMEEPSPPCPHPRLPPVLQFTGYPLHVFIWGKGIDLHRFPIVYLPTILHNYKCIISLRMENFYHIHTLQFYTHATQFQKQRQLIRLSHQELTILFLNNGQFQEISIPNHGRFPSFNPPLPWEIPKCITPHALRIP